MALPEGVVEIGLQAFEDSGLESVALPSTVRRVFPGALCRCGRLMTAALNEGLEALGVDVYLDGYLAHRLAYRGVFEGSALEDVRLPSTLRRIEYRTFYQCYRLRSARLPEGLEYLGERCFYYSGLLEICLPRSLRRIGYSIFGYDAPLRAVHVAEGCGADVLGQVGKRVVVSVVSGACE